MTTLTGTVVGGVVVWDGPPPSDGTTVRVTVDAVTPPPAAGDTDEPTLIGLLAIAGKAAGLPPDYAAQHDHYIHGAPKR